MSVSREGSPNRRLLQGGPTITAGLDRITEINLLDDVDQGAVGA